MQPFVVTVESYRGVAVADLEILYANKYLNAAGWQPDGSLQRANAWIRSGIPNVTYREFLYQTMDTPFWLSEMYVESTTRDSESVLASLKFEENRANGDSDDISIVPTIDPYQSLGYAIYARVEHFVAGDIALRIQSIKPNEKLRLVLYPVREISKTELLSFRELLKNGYLSKEFYHHNKSIRDEIGKRTRTKRVEFRRIAEAPT